MKNLVHGKNSFDISNLGRLSSIPAFCSVRKCILNIFLSNLLKPKKSGPYSSKSYQKKKSLL